MAAGPVVEGTEGAVTDTRRLNFALNSYPVRGALTVSRQGSIITVDERSHGDDKARQD